MTESVSQIPRLLHDATLTDLDWDRQLRTLRLFFSCLRRNKDGSEIEDPTVELQLGSVEEIVAYYSPVLVGVKPSEFRLDLRLTAGDLERWPGSPGQADLTINSPHADFTMATSYIKESLFLTGDQVQDGRRLRVHLAFWPQTCFPTATDIGLAIACDSIQPYANGVELDIETWKAEFDAWWTGWQEHWAASEEAEGENEEVAPEDTLIPAAESSPPDLSYRQPAQPPFQIEPTDAPAELLKPIEDFHVGLNERNWRKMALAWPCFDHTYAERASELAERYLSDEFGRWVYVRQIDSWWCEGDRACVVARGIEHTMPDDEEPATNQETVITYELRRHSNHWIIAKWMQGRPRYGSAPKPSESPAWKSGWNLAE